MPALDPQDRHFKVPKLLRTYPTALLLGLIASAAVGGTIAVDFDGTTQNGFQGSISFGWSFRVNQTVRVEALGFFDDFLIDGPGLLQDHQIRLWTDEATPQALASTTITNLSVPAASTAEDGRWLFNEIAPVELTPGDYVIGADDPACNGPTCDRIRHFNVAESIPEITFLVARDGSPQGFPGSAFPDRNDGYFGPTFRVVRVPEPAALLLLGLAGIALIVRRPKAKSVLLGITSTVLLASGPASHAATINIDEFSDYQVIATTAPGSVSHERDGLSVLGGSRELDISAFASNLTGGARFNVANVAPDALLYDPSQGPGGAIAAGRIAWDGNQDDNSDPQGFNADGLGDDGAGVDLTAGNVVRVVVNSSLPSDDSTLTIEVASDGGTNLASKTLPLPAFGSNAVTNYDFPFAEFASIDFGDISAMQLMIDTSADPGLQIEIERVVVTSQVPEPSTLVALLVGISITRITRKSYRFEVKR